MKKIEAIIRKTKFEDVRNALLEAGIEWFSYYDVRGEGKMRQTHIYRGIVYDTSSIERVLLNIVVREKNVERTIEAIRKASWTGEIGDGRILSFLLTIQLEYVQENAEILPYIMQRTKSKIENTTQTQNFLL